MVPGPILPKVADGNTEAMGQCIEAYGSLVWTLARRRLANRQDVEEVVQDIFLELWRVAGRYDPQRTAESTFVTMVARRRIIDCQRKLGRRPASATWETDSVDTGIPVARSETGELKLVRAEEATQARSLLEKLRPEEKRVLELAFDEGLAQAEIAKRTAMPLGTVKSHARRGLMRLRDWMASSNAMPPVVQPPDVQPPDVKSAKGGAK